MGCGEIPLSICRQSDTPSTKITYPDIRRKLFPANAAKCVAEIPMAGGKRNTFSQTNFHSYRHEF
jgi:hypothetical protein